MSQWNWQDDPEDSAIRMGVQFVDLTSMTLDVAVVHLASEATCRRFHVIPVARQNQYLYLAMANPLDVDAIDAVAEATGLRVQPVLARWDAIQVVLDLYFPEA